MLEHIRLDSPEIHYLRTGDMVMVRSIVLPLEIRRFTCRCLVDPVFPFARDVVTFLGPRHYRALVAVSAVAVTVKVCVSVIRLAYCRAIVGDIGLVRNHSADFLHVCAVTRLS